MNQHLPGMWSASPARVAPVLMEREGDSTRRVCLYALNRTSGVTRTRIKGWAE